MPYAIRLLPAVCCLLAALIYSAPADARRVALVIGNSAYKVGPLANPANDAAAVAKALEEQVKFDKVILKKDLGFNALRDALSQFSSEAMGAEMAVVYFAGHGIEASGVNYLIPVDAMLRRASDLNLQAIALQTVLEQLDGVRTFKLIILDACRNNPFPLPGARRTVQRGLASFSPDGNTLVLYAAKDGTTAEDGAGRKHSPFTEGLLKHIATPGLEVGLLIRRVRDEVMKATGSMQVPHLYGTLGSEEVYLLKDAPVAPVAEKPPAPAPEKLPAAEKPPAPDVLADLKLPPRPPAVEKKDKAPSPAPPPVVKKDPAPPAPVVQKEKVTAPSAERPFDQIVADVRATVVSIEVVKPSQEKDKVKDKQPPVPDGLEDFFNKRYGKKADQGVAQSATGLSISPDGYVVASHAAVAGAISLKIRVGGKGTYKAETVGVDERTGVALLKIGQPGTWPYVALSGSDAKLGLGDPVFAIGSAFGLSSTVLKGSVTGLDRDIGYGPYNFVQTDIAFPRDDFLGSPLFDMRGRVVGITVGKGAGEKASIVFVFPARDVLSIVEQLKVHGTVKRGWLGVRIQNIDGDIAAALGTSEPKGALVAEVQTPSPAATAGIKRGDAILSVNGIKVSDSRDLSRTIASFQPDTTVELKVVRLQKELSVSVKLGLLPSAQELPRYTPGTPTRATELSQLGLSVAPAEGPIREGVRVTFVEVGSPAATKIRVGDIILEADNHPVNSAEDLIAVIRQANQQNRMGILLLIQSGNETRFEMVPLRGN